MGVFLGGGGLGASGLYGDNAIMIWSSVLVPEGLVGAVFRLTNGLCCMRI